MGKLFAFLNLLRKGEEISNVEAWHTGHISVNAVGAFILALALVLKKYGIELPIDNATALELAGGVIAVVNIVFASITSKRAGILPARSAPAGEPAPVAPSPAGAGEPAPTSYWDNKDNDPTKF